MNLGDALLVLTAVLWAVLIAVLFTVVGVESFGDRDIMLGVRWLLAGVIACGIWVCLGVLLRIAAKQGALAGSASVAAWTICIASLAGTLAAMYVLSHAETRWPLMFMAIPPLVAAYAFALLRPSLRAFFAEPGAHFAVWGAVAALSLPACVPYFRMMVAEWSHHPMSVEEYMAAEAREKQNRRVTNLDRLKAGSPGDDWEFWDSLLGPASEVRVEAAAALRQGPHRQDYVERALRLNVDGVLPLLPELDLEPTPAICAAANARLGTLAARMKPLNRYYENMEIEQAFGAIAWLQAHGCDCGKGLNEAAEAVAGFAESPERNALLARLKQEPR